MIKTIDKLSERNINEMYHESNHVFSILICVTLKTDDSYTLHCFDALDKCCKSTVKSQSHQWFYLTPAMTGHFSKVKVKTIVLVPVHTLHRYWTYFTVQPVVNLSILQHCTVITFSHIRFSHVNKASHQWHDFPPMRTMKISNQSHETFFVYHFFTTRCHRQIFFFCVSTRSILFHPHLNEPQNHCHISRILMPFVHVH